MNFAARNQTWNAIDWREPDIVSDKDTDATTGNLATFTTNLTSDFKKMAVSVATYGGFYVSRYEVGAGGSSTQGQKVLNAGESSANTWYGLYNTLRGVNKHMIWGSQYDQMINFIGTEAQTGHANRNLAMVASANSGNNPLDVMKNVYDLEGNFGEWTVQAVDTNIRVGRGGVYKNENKGYFYPASNHYKNEPSDKDVDLACRLSFYL